MTDSLTVATNTTTLKANSIWGLLHAFETFNQLLYYSDDFKELFLNETKIFDYPRYSHRGLLLDTGHNQLSLDSLYRTLDAMAMNKMNVLHWHIVDDDTFPYVSKKFPKLSEKGASDQSLVYRGDELRELVQYAAGLGIRVVPELDVPDHTRFWGEAFPSLLTPCPAQAPGLLDPSNPHVYPVVAGLLAELQELFPDQLFHLGGHQLDVTCWESSPAVAGYMQRRGLTSRQLLAEFEQCVMSFLAARTTSVVWQEVFELIPLPNNSVIQVWTPHNKDPTFLERVIKAGHEVVWSSGWALAPGSVNASAVYGAEPGGGLQGARGAQGVAGGEACVWGGGALRDNNFMQRVWPLASLVAEVLWSAGGGARRHLRGAMPRLEELACRMRRRRLHADSPAGPAACLPART